MIGIRFPVSNIGYILYLVDKIDGITCSVIRHPKQGSVSRFMVIELNK